MAGRNSASVAIVIAMSQFFGAMVQGYGPPAPVVAPVAATVVAPVEPRCSAYNVLPYDPAMFNYELPWYVSASSVAGTVIGWNEPETVVCDSTFTVGAQCCGLCTFVQFCPNNEVPEDFSMNMVESAFNECNGGYDMTSSVVFPAYQSPSKSVYRVFRSQNYNKWLTSTDSIDHKLVDTPKYRTVPLKYSFGVILAEADVLVLVFCNNFNYVTYNGSPNVLVLSKSAYLSKDVRAKIQQTLLDNKIDPNGLSFRNNYECPDIVPFVPRSLFPPRRRPLLKKPIH